jgi:hypothetical protein
MSLKTDSFGYSAKQYSVELESGKKLQLSDLQKCLGGSLFGRTVHRILTGLSSGVWVNEQMAKTILGSLKPEELRLISHIFQKATNADQLSKDLFTQKQAQLETNIQSIRQKEASTIKGIKNKTMERLLNEHSIKNAFQDTQAPEYRKVIAQTVATMIGLSHSSPLPTDFENNPMNYVHEENVPFVEESVKKQLEEKFSSMTAEDTLQNLSTFFGIRFNDPILETMKNEATECAQQAKAGIDELTAKAPSLFLQRNVRQEPESQKMTTIREPALGFFKEKAKKLETLLGNPVSMTSLVAAGNNLKKTNITKVAELLSGGSLPITCTDSAGKEIKDFSSFKSLYDLALNVTVKYDGHDPETQKICDAHNQRRKNLITHELLTPLRAQFDEKLMMSFSTIQHLHAVPCPDMEEIAQTARLNHLPITFSDANGNEIKDFSAMKLRSLYDLFTKVKISTFGPKDPLTNVTLRGICSDLAVSRSQLLQLDVLEKIGLLNKGVPLPGGPTEVLETAKKLPPPNLNATGIKESEIRFQDPKGKEISLEELKQKKFISLADFLKDVFIVYGGKNLSLTKMFAGGTEGTFDQVALRNEWYAQKSRSLPPKELLRTLSCAPDPQQVQKVLETENAVIVPTPKGNGESGRIFVKVPGKDGKSATNFIDFRITDKGEIMLDKPPNVKRFSDNGAFMAYLLISYKTVANLSKLDAITS